MKCLTAWVVGSHIACPEDDHQTMVKEDCDGWGLPRNQYELNKILGGGSSQIKRSVSLQAASPAPSVATAESSLRRAHSVIIDDGLLVSVLAMNCGFTVEQITTAMDLHPRVKGTRLDSHSVVAIFSS
jgi:hypothetical protein